MIRQLWLCGLLLGAGCRITEPAQRPEQADAAPAAPMTANAQPAGQGAVASAPSADKGVPVAAASPDDPALPQTPTRTKPATQACATDTDCYAVSNYCGGCNCEVANAKEERRCKDGERVACLVDPCMNKSTTCQQGRCQLVDKEPPPR